jgi:hypothetical protein
LPGPVLRNSPPPAPTGPSVCSKSPPERSVEPRLSQLFSPRERRRKKTNNNMRKLLVYPNASFLQMYRRRTRFRRSCFRLVSDRLENCDRTGVVVRSSFCRTATTSAEARERGRRKGKRTLDHVLPQRHPHAWLLRDKLAELLLRKLQQRRKRSRGDRLRQADEALPKRSDHPYLLAN